MRRAMMDPDAHDESGPNDGWDATHRKARRVKAPLRGIIAATVLAGTLTLTGCGSDHWTGTAGTAAVVDGSKISTDDAMVAAEQINEQFKPDTPLTASTALNYLVVAPAYIAVADANGIPTSASAARTQLTDVSDPADSTVTLLQVNTIAQTLNQWGQAQATQAKATEVQKEIVSAIGKQDISVSPRFGTFDASQFTIKAAAPNWISKTVAPQSTTGDDSTDTSGDGSTGP